jgi:hypothetical protein
MLIYDLPQSDCAMDPTCRSESPFEASPGARAGIEARSRALYVPLYGV